MQEFDVQHSEASTSRARVQREAVQIWVHAFDTAGAEEHSVDKHHSAEVHKVMKSVCGCLCWDIFCCENIPASFQAQNIYRMRNSSQVRY